MSTAYYADEQIFDGIKGLESFTIPEEYLRLGDSMHTAVVSSCIQNYLMLHSYKHTNVNRTYIYQYTLLIKLMNIKIIPVY